MGRLLMLKLFENFKKVSGIDQMNHVSEEVTKLERTIERLNGAKHITLFRTDYLE